MRRRRLVPLLLLLASPAVALAQSPLWPGGSAQEGAPEPNPQATVQALRTLHWKNQLEITLARQALARAERASVRRLAEQALQDHELVDARLLAISKRLDLDLRPPAAEEHARTEQVQQMLQELTSLSGSEFEVVWLRMMVNEHRESIQQLAGLRPRVDVPEVRALLRDVLPLFDQHLAMARALQPDARVGLAADDAHAPLWIRVVGGAWR